MNAVCAANHAAVTFYRIFSDVGIAQHSDSLVPTLSAAELLQDSSRPCEFKGHTEKGRLLTSVSFHRSVATTASHGHAVTANSVSQGAYSVSV